MPRNAEQEPSRKRVITIAEALQRFLKRVRGSDEKPEQNKDQGKDPKNGGDPLNAIAS